ncbi:MAG: low temperature requirement protein A [Acidimicrobiia bacterium]|nr:low temperature requirement protein A [Acidimicrobiia bacterium]MBP8180351.1 low temperature requirement protein A [Acidimicrobiia bacterium]
MTAPTSSDQDLARQRVKAGLRRWFLTPPRQHGEVDYGRRVSNLELFYDLVFVVIIGRATHHLATHLDGGGVVDFVVLFSLIWLSWFNGTVWHELHGRQDGRSRLNIFCQMGVLAVLAVFTADAATDSGPAFARTLAVLYGGLTWQWFRVQQVDEDPQYRPRTRAFIAGMVLTTTAFVASSFVEDADVRMTIWGVVVVLWVIGGFVFNSADRTAGFGDGVTESLVERFGLFTIIVLGEVIIGVVGGMSDAANHDTATIAVGVLGLMIGMGIWWSYFDLLGERLPSRRGIRLGGWMSLHLPISTAIAASGAAITNLVEHAHDARAPESASILLGASLAIVLVSIWLATFAIPDELIPSGLRSHFGPTLLGAAAVILITSMINPSPLILLISINIALFIQWFWLFVVYLAKGAKLPNAPSEELAR